METNWKKWWLSGMKNGLAVALGYFAVSFTFGILAKQAGLNPFEALFMSVTNVTSAGQFAGLTLIASAATIIEVVLAQIIINSRYFIMSFALTQKIDPDTPLLHRMLIAYGITDEVFALNMATPGKLSPYYAYGVVSVAIPGWVLGTLFGVISGNLLSERLISALSIALYGMLLAVIIPPARDDKVIGWLIVLSMAASALFASLPVLSSISSGVKIIVLTISIAGIAAMLFPVTEEESAYE